MWVWVKSGGVLVLFGGLCVGVAGALLWAMKYAPWLVIGGVLVTFVATIRYCVFDRE